MIKIVLNENYRSFDTNFETVLEGKLIILSGVNGSGKSQLMSIIIGDKGLNPQTGQRSKDLNRVVTINGVAISWKNIEIRTFKDNISIPEIIKSTSNIFNTATDQAYNLYKENRLNPMHNPTFSDSIEKAIQLLGEHYNPNTNDIREDKFKSILRDANYVWEQNDVFNDTIGNLFFHHASEIAEGQKNAGKIDGSAFDPLTLGMAPWDELNDLFEILNIEYRFKDNYDIKYGELTETPMLFQIDTNGNLNEKESRPLNDLSDGEKAIISLCFTSLKKIDTHNKKILLLDEFDATLNPSLIESLFIVIKKYFIDKDIAVIMTTHSPATISLAPDYANYYEVFKKNNSKVRIFKIDRDDYSELQKVNKQFYDKISNQAGRIKELEASIDSTEEVLIITEGKTDWKYILRALGYFHDVNEFLKIKPEYFYRFGNQDDVNNAICGTNIFADMSESQLNNFLSSEINSRTVDVSRRKQIRIGIFDSDTNIKTNSKSEYGVFSFKITPKNISTEFLFIESDIKKEIGNERLFIGNEFKERSLRHINSNLNLGINSSKKAGKPVIIDTDVFDENDLNKSLSKEKFAQAVFNNVIQISDESWENFRHVFENILSFLPVEKIEVSESNIEEH
jgi:ABC-type branched-subunit amino acid transport system ATPase component